VNRQRAASHPTAYESHSVQVAVDLNGVTSLAIDLEKVIEAPLSLAVVNDTGGDLAMRKTNEVIGRNRFRLERHCRFLFQSQRDHSGATHS
jgi:hypothetical protein